MNFDPAKFTPFSPLHFACLVACGVGWAVLVKRARAARGTPRESGFRFRLGLATIAFNASWMLYRLTPAYYDVDASLPLHACDFAWWLGAAAILRTSDGARLDRDFAFYFGIGLAPLGVITPVLTDGPSDIDFWAFWFRHFLIPACALVDLLAFGFRPTRRGCAIVVAVTLAALVPITWINLRLGTSYFFTGKETPENPTPLDALGDWPLRLVWIGAIGVAWLFALQAIVRPLLETGRAGDSVDPASDRVGSTRPPPG